VLKRQRQIPGALRSQTQHGPRNRRQADGPKIIPKISDPTLGRLRPGINQQTHYLVTMPTSQSTLANGMGAARMSRPGTESPVAGDSIR